jgi:RNase P subunit RPR2
MKTPITRTIRLAFCTIATGLLLSSQASAGTRLNCHVPITSREQATGLPPGAKIAMACTNCQTVQVRDVDKKRTFLDWFSPSVKHTCPGCGGYYEYTYRRMGVPFSARYIHTCSKCGDKSMFCCSTRPAQKTRGM